MHSHRGFFRHRVLAIGASIAVAIIVGGRHPVAAAEIAADLSAYCAATFGANTETGTDRRDNGLLCIERTNGGLGLRYHRIEPASVCRVQHQTDRYRREAGSLVCLSDDGGASGQRSHDLAEYCRRNYGTGAIVSRRLTDGQPLCTVRDDSGRSQAHHLIDTRELCGGTAGSVSGDTLDCAPAGTASDTPAGGAAEAKTGDAGGNSAERPDAPGGDAEPGGGVPETAIVHHSDEPDLRNCGLAQGLELVELGYSFPLAEGNWENGTAPTPCTGLSGGFKPDLDAYCRDHFGGTTPGILPDGRPICHPPGFFPTGPEADGYWMILASVCSTMYPQPADLRRGSVDAAGNIMIDGSLYPVVKYQNGSLECFYLDVTGPEFELRLMEGAHGDVREVADRIEFFGGPFYYDVIYRSPPADPIESVSIESLDGGDPELTLMVSPLPGSELIYRSEAFYIEAPSDDGLEDEKMPPEEIFSEPQDEEENSEDISIRPAEREEDKLDQCSPSRCTVIDDKHIGDGPTNLTYVATYGKDGKLVTWVPYKKKDGFDEKNRTVHKRLYVANTAYKHLGNGNHAIGIRVVNKAFEKQTTRRTERGCSKVHCTCKNLKMIRSGVRLIKDREIDVDKVVKGVKYKFYFVRDVSVFRKTFEGTCGVEHLPVRSREFKNPTKDR